MSNSRSTSKERRHGKQNRNFLTAFEWDSHIKYERSINAIEILDDEFSIINIFEVKKPRSEVK